MTIETDNVVSLIDRATADNAPALSEEALALTFANRHSDRLRHVALWGKWLQYDGKVWKFDDTRETFSMARQVCREMASTANKIKDSKAIASAKTRAAVVSLASDDRRLAATVDQWDADPWLLNTPGGAVDLRTGLMRPSRASDYMTKTTAATPDASCPTPLWTKFLKTATAGNKDLKNYLARMFGYGLTGLTTEQSLFFFYGSGANGKGVLLNTVADIFGDYHCAVPMETFTDTGIEKHPTDLAMMRGSRLVTSTETEEGRNWAESRIKMLTGGERIKARFMRQDFFEYIPQFKINISGNHKPGLRSVDEAIKRRMNLIPFTVTIPKKDRDLELRTKLEQEWPGILAWMIEGSLDWQKVKGLATPKVVVDATDAYLAEEDAIRLWMEEYCDRGADKSCSVERLFTNWKVYAGTTDERAGSSKRFSQRLDTLGLERKKINNKRSFLGIDLKPAQAQTSDPKPKEPGL